MLDKTALVQPLPSWKRGFDLLGASVALIVLSPLMLMVAVYIRIVSPGPVFFRHRRYGYQGKPFHVWKFRSMHVSHDPNNHQEHVFTLAKNNNLQLKKMAAQSQLIPLGGLLRNTALDELPQVFNVLLGEMSLVGPRPDVLHPDEYDEEDKLRFDVLPGLTGLWQVSGKNRTTFAEMIQLDSAYVKQRSLWLDSKIVVLTVPAICRQIADERVARRKAG